MADVGTRRRGLMGDSKEDAGVDVLVVSPLFDPPGLVGCRRAAVLSDSSRAGRTRAGRTRASGLGEVDCLGDASLETSLSHICGDATTAVTALMGDRARAEGRGRRAGGGGASGRRQKKSAGKNLPKETARRARGGFVAEAGRKRAEDLLQKRAGRLLAYSREPGAT